MDLGYRLPNKLLGSLAETACRYINAFPTPSSNDNIPPWEYFTGRKVDYERDFRPAVLCIRILVCCLISVSSVK